MSLLLKSVAENTPVVKLDVVSLVCSEGSLYHDFGNPKRALKGHCVCCSQKLRPLNLNLQCKICGIKLHRYCEFYRQSVTACYHKDSNFLARVLPSAKQYFIIQNLSCKGDSPNHQWSKVWIKQEQLCNICNQPKPYLACTNCDLSVHGGYCIQKLTAELQKLTSLLTNGGMFSVQEMNTSNLELKHHFIRTVDTYMSTRNELVAVTEDFFRETNNSLGSSHTMQHGDVKDTFANILLQNNNKNSADKHSTEDMSSKYSQILYPFGGVTCLKEFIGLPGAFGSVPGTGIVSSIVERDTEKLQLLHVAPEMALERSQREEQEHEMNPCSKDCSWLPTALCCSPNRQISFRCLCSDSSLIHLQVEETDHAEGKNCEFCFRIIRRNGLQCLNCGILLHTYCENFRLDKLRRDYPQEFFFHQLIKTNSLSLLPEPVKKSFMYCQTDTRIAKRHSLRTINGNVEKLLTPKLCLVCRKMVFITGKKGEKECENCQEIVHAKCEKFLTMKSNLAPSALSNERAFLTENLTDSFIEKENFNIQQETYNIRQHVLSLEKLTQQLDSSRNNKCASSTSSKTEEHQLSTVSEKSESELCRRESLTSCAAFENANTNSENLKERQLCRENSEHPSLGAFSTTTTLEETDSRDQDLSDLTQHCEYSDIGTLEANDDSEVEQNPTSTCRDQNSTMQESYNIEAVHTPKDNSQIVAQSTTGTREYSAAEWQSKMNASDDVRAHFPQIQQTVEFNEAKTLTECIPAATQTMCKQMSAVIQKAQVDKRHNITINDIKCASVSVHTENLSDTLDSVQVYGTLIKIKEQIVVWE
ncbi:uncharacterized protein LOC142348250 [Convolutriloba macropyga]|uniref:uncharacterized protein LOC142348250 n=1 Tax=Convolutriloba macropyga TaxID=536237 RepID=UPI003F521FB2